MCNNNNINVIILICNNINIINNINNNIILILMIM